MRTTLNQIRAANPCTGGYRKLLASLGKTAGDDEPITIEYIVNSNGATDAIWCLRAVSGYTTEKRLFAIWCARQVQHLANDRIKNKLDAAEISLTGKIVTVNTRSRATATYSAVVAANAAAANATYAAANAAANAIQAAYTAAYTDATHAAATATAADAAASAAAATHTATHAVYTAFRTLQGLELVRICQAIEAQRPESTQIGVA